jgi:hypothetical protein
MPEEAGPVFFNTTYLLLNWWLPSRHTTVAGY